MCFKRNTNIKVATPNLKLSKIEGHVVRVTLMEEFRLKLLVILKDSLRRQICKTIKRVSELSVGQNELTPCNKVL